MKIIYLLIAALILFNCEFKAQERDEEEEEEYEMKQELQDSTKKKVTALEEIVVTGTRAEKKIIDIPYSVFRVNKKEFTFGRDLNARDILQDVPGLFIQTKYGSDVRISIRGFGTRSNNGVRGIRILLDGIPESEPDGETSMDAIDYTTLGGVEVVKGNLSSLYPNSPGGVVNFISNLNFNKSFLTLTGIAGEYNLFQGGFRLGLKNNNSRFYLSHTYKHYTGYRPHGAEFSHLLNANYISYPDDNTVLTVLGNYLRGLSRFPGALTLEEYNSDPFQPYFQAVSSDFRRETEKGRVGLKYKRTWGRENNYTAEFTGFGSVKEIESTSNTLYNIRHKNYVGASFRFTGKIQLLKHENEFTAGTEYSYLFGTVSAFLNYGGIKGDELQSLNSERQGNYGFYFENHFGIIKNKMYFLLSGRYDNLEFINNDELFSVRNSKRGFSRFTPKAAVNYKLTPLVSVYTSYGFGFDSPALSELENYPLSSNNGLTTLNPDINPQISRNFETGIKGNLFNRKAKFFKKALFEFTFFNTIINDEIVPFIISDKVYYRNAAETNRTGIECGTKFEPAERVDLLINYTYTDFKYSSYLSRTYDSIGNPFDIDYTGNRVPAVPRHLVNLILETEPEFARGIEGLFVFDCDYVSEMFTDDLNTEKTSAYFYANLMAGVTFYSKKWQLRLAAGVKNIFDRRYTGFININANPEFSNGKRRYYEVGEPRNYYLSVNLDYNF